MAERRVKAYVGDAAIGRAIKSLNTRLENVNDDVQDIAVSIIVHAAGPGNGDMSRALDLCKTVKRHRTLNVAFLVGYFRHFGNANVNLNANEGAGKVSLIDRKSANYRGFDVDGARANKWYEAVNDDGERAGWYAGPVPAEFQPYTIGDEAKRIANFVKGERKRLEDTKVVNGVEVPLVKLAEPDRLQMMNALDFMERIAATLARHEDIHQKAQELAAAQEEAGKDEVVVQIMQQPVPDKAVA